MAEPVQLEAQGDGVAVITLNRPERLNALTGRMMDELIPAACAQADADPDVRVVVVRGAGGNFCSGGDLQERVAAVQRRLVQHDAARAEPDAAPQHDAAAPAEPDAAPVQDLGLFVLPFLAMEKPTIAAVDGVAAGGGLAIALACDLRAASDRARLSAPFVKRALVPDGGLTVTLLEVLGLPGALDLCLTGRQVGGEEAARLGLVQRCWPAEAWWDETLALARDIAAGPVLATRLTKRALVEGHLEAVRAALVRESWFQFACMRDPDFQEGIESFLQRRKPTFDKGRGGDGAVH